MDLQNFKQVWELLVSNGLTGVLVGVFVFALVLLGKYSGWVKNGTWARIAAAFTALAVGGAEAGNVDANISSVLAVMVSGLLHELGEFLKDRKDKTG